MQLSIIILNYKVPYYLLNCLASVTKAVQHIEAEVIVVDNASQDESLALVKTHFPEVKTIALSTNYGFSKGNNIGVKNAKGTYICLLNPDTFVGEGIFEAFLDFAHQHDDFGALGPQLIDGAGLFLPESKRNIPTPRVALSKLIGRSQPYYASLPRDQNSEVQILVGAFLFMKKARYVSIGGLDEDYFMYGEDIDLCFSLLKHNCKNYYLGRESALHFKGESTVKDKKYRDVFFGAMKIFYKKNFSQGAFSKRVINTGLSLAKTVQVIKKKKVVDRPVDKLFYLGGDRLFFEKLKKRFPSAEQIGDDNVKDLPEHSTLVIDLGEFSNTETIKLMKAHSKRKMRYRMRPENFGFIIGSDENTSRGKVIEL